MNDLTQLELELENLEHRVVRLLEVLDKTLASSKAAIDFCARANERQALTIVELKQQVSDALAGLEWRDAEIRCLKRTAESLGREKELLLQQQYVGGVA